MKDIFKVVWETADNEKRYSFYESTSISALLSYLGDCGFAVGFIIEVKRVTRLPKVGILLKGCYD